MMPGALPTSFVAQSSWSTQRPGKKVPCPPFEIVEHEEVFPELDDDCDSLEGLPADVRADLLDQERLESEVLLQFWMSDNLPT